jgi:hemerythrin
MNPYVAWKSYYSVGNPAIDAEHQQLLALINKIYEAVQRGDDQAVAKSALNVMLQYALTHFQHEEQIMREGGFPHFAEHSALHEEFRQQARAWRAQAYLVTGHDLLRYLKRWWVGHIQSEDKKYMPYLSLADSRR